MRTRLKSSVRNKTKGFFSVPLQRWPRLASKPFVFKERGGPYTGRNYLPRVLGPSASRSGEVARFSRSLCVLALPLPWPPPGPPLSRPVSSSRCAPCCRSSTKADVGWLTEWSVVTWSVRRRKARAGSSTGNSIPFTSLCASWTRKSRMFEASFVPPLLLSFENRNRFRCPVC